MIWTQALPTIRNESASRTELSSKTITSPSHVEDSLSYQNSKSLTLTFHNNSSENILSNNLTDQRRNESLISQPVHCQDNTSSSQSQTMMLKRFPSTCTWLECKDDYEMVANEPSNANDIAYNKRISNLEHPSTPMPMPALAVATCPTGTGDHQRYSDVPSMDTSDYDKTECANIKINDIDEDIDAAYTGKKLKSSGDSSINNRSDSNVSDILKHTHFQHPQYYQEQQMSYTGTQTGLESRTYSIANSYCTQLNDADHGFLIGAGIDSAAVRHQLNIPSHLQTPLGKGTSEMKLSNNHKKNMYSIPEMEEYYPHVQLDAQLDVAQKDDYDSPSNRGQDASYDHTLSPIVAATDKKPVTSPCSDDYSVSSVSSTPVDKCLKPNLPILVSDGDISQAPCSKKLRFSNTGESVSPDSETSRVLSTNIDLCSGITNHAITNCNENIVTSELSSARIITVSAETPTLTDDRLEDQHIASWGKDVSSCLWRCAYLILLFVWSCLVDVWRSADAERDDSNSIRCP